MLGQLSDIFYVETPCIYDGVSQIYTTVLALVYLVFGAFLFCRRKSESAQRSAPSKRMQAIYRIILAFTVSVPFCYVIFGYDNDPVSLVFLCGMLALLSGLTYFIYEILTTRKWKNLIRAIPGFFIVLLLDVLLFGTMYGITALESTFRPKPEDIEYVQLVGERYGQENYGLDFKSYVEQETAKMKITDDEGIKTVADCLNETFEFYEKYGGIDEWYSDSYHGSYVEKEEYAEIYTFKIKTDGGLTKYRNVRLYSEDVNVIRESLKKLDGYTEMWTSLPTPQRGTLTMDSGAFEITNEQAEKIFEVFRRELVSVDFDKWVEFNMGYEAAFAWFHYRTASVYLTVPVSAELFPKTVDQLLLYAKVNSDENFKAIKEAYEKYENAYVQWAELLVYENGTFNYYGTVSDFHTEDRLELVLDSRDDSVFKIGDSFLRVDIEFYNEESDKKLEKDDMKYLSCIIKVNDEAKEKLAPLFDGAFKG